MGFCWRLHSLERNIPAIAPRAPTGMSEVALFLHGIINQRMALRVTESGTHIWMAGEIQLPSPRHFMGFFQPPSGYANRYYRQPRNQGLNR